MRLLLAVDLSESSTAVVAAAADWAKRLNGTLSLAYAEGTIAVSDFLSDPHVRALLEQEAARPAPATPSASTSCSPPCPCSFAASG